MTPGQLFQPEWREFLSGLPTSAGIVIVGLVALVAVIIIVYDSVMLVIVAIERFHCSSHRNHPSSPCFVIVIVAYAFEKKLQLLSESMFYT